MGGEICKKVEFPLLLRHGRERKTKSLEKKKKIDLTSDSPRVNEDEASYLDKFPCRSQIIWIWEKNFPKFEFECKNSLITSCLYLLSSNWLVWEVLHKFDVAITLGPICPNLYFRYKTLKYWCQIRI